MRKMKALGAVGLAMALGTAGQALASSHREAPFLAKSPKVDGTDVYAFQSYESGRTSGYTTILVDYQPFQDPFGGPNYFTLDDKALYEILIDNVGDAHEHLTFQFRFTNTLNGGTGLALPIGPTGNQKTVAVALDNLGPITAADSSKLNVQETYQVQVVVGDRRLGKGDPLRNHADQSTTFTKPTDNIGKKTFPDYPGYASNYVYTVDVPNCTAGTGRLFVGQRKEPFAVNLGPVFDLVDAPAAVITNNSLRGAVPNPLDKKNITTLALEIPTSCLLSSPSQPIIGVWSTASVRQARVINPSATYAVPAREGGAWTQVSRLGAPLVNEVFIGLKDKDHWNSSEPKDDGQFIDYVQYPTLPAILEVLFGAAGLKAPTVFPRADLVAAFLTGVPNVNMIPNSSPAEYLRLNTALPPTTAASQNDLGAAACFVNGALTLTNAGCDPAGFPNGRRPGDDVVDIELRVAMGYLLTNDTDAPSRNVPLHDAVLQTHSQFDVAFPYLKPPLAGANGDGT